MLCDICQQPLTALIRYDDYPFIDGKYYDIVCHICHSVPRTWQYDQEGNVIYYGYLDCTRLASVQTLMREGWDQQQALCSIRAVKKLIKYKEYSIHIRQSFFIIKQLYNMNVELW